MKKIAPTISSQTTHAYASLPHGTLISAHHAPGLRHVDGQRRRQTSGVTVPRTRQERPGQCNVEAPSLGQAVRHGLVTHHGMAERDASNQVSLILAQQHPQPRSTRACSEAKARWKPAGAPRPAGFAPSSTSTAERAAAGGE